MSGPAAESGKSDAASRWRRTEELFHRAMDLPAAERSQQVREWCGADIELAASVLELIAADSSVEELLSSAPQVDPGEYLTRGSRGEPDPGGDASEEDAWIGRMLGQFRLERLLGRGGMGVVYLGQRVSGGFSQTVAIKLVGRHLRSSPAVTQFLLEREALAKLHHAHIAQLIDGGVTSEGFPYLVMEYVEGRRLDEACDDPATSMEQILQWMQQLCDAVAYVHRNLILHRDLKPGNVMVTVDGQIKLLDFGTLKLLGPGADAESEMTRAGMRPVTVRYASPEHIQGTGVSTAADVYSLGMILYRLIAGRLPDDLNDLTIGRYLEGLKGGRIKPPTQMATNRRFDASTGSDLDAIVAKALRYEPEARYLTANALADDLWKLRSNQPVGARAGNFQYKAGKFYRRYRWPIRAAAAALLVLILGLSAMAWQGHLARLEELRAEKGVEDERQLAHMLLFDYFEQLSLIPGSVEAQRKAVTQATQYLDGLAKIAPGSSLELETIEGYKDMGNLLGNSYKQNLGNVPAALQSLEKAQAMAQARMKRNPHDLESLGSLISATYALGGTLLGNGDAVRAEQVMLPTVGMAAEIGNNPKADANLLLDASSALDILGDVYDPGRGFTTANMSKAIETYLLSAEYDDRCAKKDPTNNLCRSGIVVDEYKFGSLVEETDPELAASHYRHGSSVVSQFPPELMKTTRSHRLKNYMLCRTGLMEIRLGHTAQGVALAKQAIDGFHEAIAKAELDNRARFDLVAFETDLSPEYDRSGMEKEALDTAHEVLDVLAVLLQRSPKNIRWQMIQAQDFMMLGRIETKLGHTQKGAEASKKGLDQMVRLAQDKDASPETLIFAADGLLELHLHPQDAAQALTFAQRAVSVYARPAPSQLLVLAKAQHAVGHLQEAAKNAQLVLTAFAGPVKSRVVADEIAEARRLLKDDRDTKASVATSQ